VENSLHNVISETGHVEGFEFQIRIPYYWGVFLSLVDKITVKAAGQVYTNDDIRFTVKSGSFMMNEMETVGTLRWNFDEAATLFIKKPGGIISSQRLELEIEIYIRPPYMTFRGYDKKRPQLGPEKKLTVAAS
jgi:hypothetical protein